MKVLPYIIIIIVLLVAGGLYLQMTKPEGSNLLNLSFNSDRNIESAEQSSPEQPKFTNKGPAPEFTGINKWLNSDPLTMESLRGKVVLVDFWTYSCINCIRTLPYVTKWYETYKDQGFVIVGVHTPEFAFERVTSNVETALKRYDITYPIAQDNNYKTWSAFKNQFWPAHYLIDQNGNIVYTHFGEGQYEETEMAIRTLLGLEGEFAAPPMPEQNQARTPEIYLGTLRLGNSFGGAETPTAEEQLYFFPDKLARNKFALEGKWLFEPESVKHTSGFAKIRLNFNAANVFMVAEATEPTTAKVYVDGKLVKGVVIGESDLYSLFESDAGAERILEIEFPNGGIKIFTFTFG